MRTRRGSRATVATGRRPAVCEVWWATPGSADLLELLDATERRRAARLHRPQDRARFVTARAVLRLVLGELLGTTPSELRLDVTCPRCGGEHGKPRLLGGDGSVSFSIAHVAGRVAVAVADGTAVGVDVEATVGRSAVDLTDLATDILSPAELRDHQRIAPLRRAHALAVCWTRKESVLKATGDGLMVPLRDVVVTASDHPAALREVPGVSSGRHRTAMATLHDLAPGEGLVGCVAALRVSSLTVTERDGDALLAGTTSARSLAEVSR